jgi:preprotein translocase subunit YajC
VFIETAYAMGAPSGSGGGGDALVSFIPLILIFVIFYFLLIRPQQKKAKQHRELLANLKKGDTVITSGGIYGKITSNVKPEDQDITLEIADKVRVKVARSHISGLSSKPLILEPKKKEES